MVFTTVDEGTRSNSSSQDTSASQFSAKEDKSLSKPQGELTLEGGIKGSFGPGIQLSKQSNGDIELLAGGNRVFLLQEPGRTVLRLKDETGSWHNLPLDSNTARVEASVKEGNLLITVRDFAKNGIVSSRPVVVNGKGYEIGDSFKVPASILAKPVPEAGFRLGTSSEPLQGSGAAAEISEFSPTKENLTDTSPENVNRIFNNGFSKAKAEAAKEGLELRFGGSGAFAKGIGANTVSMIELQDVFARERGSDKWIKIGSVIPEKDHLRTLFSSLEIRDQVLQCVENAKQNGLIANHAPREDLSDFSPENVTAIFERGFKQAEALAAKQGIELSFGGSGLLAKSLGALEVNPIEYQNISARMNGSDEWIEIGKVLPEKESRHLLELHSSQEIRDQVNALVKGALASGKLQ